MIAIRLSTGRYKYLLCRQTVPRSHREPALIMPAAQKVTTPIIPRPALFTDTHGAGPHIRLSYEITYEIENCDKNYPLRQPVLILGTADDTLFTNKRSSLWSTWLSGSLMNILRMYSTIEYVSGINGWNRASKLVKGNDYYQCDQDWVGPETKTALETSIYKSRQP